MLKIVCSNCEKEMGQKECKEEGISHSICEACVRTLYGDEFTEEEIQIILKGG